MRIKTLKTAAAALCICPLLTCCGENSFNNNVVSVIDSIDLRTEETELDAFNKIIIEGSSGDVTLMEDISYGITTVCPDGHSVSFAVTDGTLTVSLEPNSAEGYFDAVVTYPADTAFESIEVNVLAGNIDMTGGMADYIRLGSTSGNIKVNVPELEETELGVYTNTGAISVFGNEYKYKFKQTGTNGKRAVISAGSGNIMIR